MFRKIMRVTRLPLPFRRLFWSVGLNFGRQRGNWFGSFGVTSVAALGPGELHPHEPGPVHPQLWRAGTGPDHPGRDPLGSPDYGWSLVAKVMTRLEQVLNGEIAAELGGNRQQIEPKAVRAVGT